jgi:glycolate oxidase iron-sulfur subunit
VKDVHEWLAQAGIRHPGGVQPAQVVTYHEACHLCHGQRITAEPRALLRSIPGLELRELPESQWCCGSAGIYNLVQPEMAGELLKRKLRHIESTGAPIVATGNPGCLLHIDNGVRNSRLKVRLVHPVTLLAEAYRREAGGGAT